MLCRAISRRNLFRGAAALLPASRLLAQDPGLPTFSSDVSVVSVLVTVRGHDGNLVSDLTEDDFAIEEDGHPQVIQYFSKQFDSPLTLGLLVDTSLSELQKIGVERAASERFFDRVLREGKDQAFLMNFDTHLVLRRGLTSSRALLYKGLDQVRPSPGGAIGTLVYDAVTGSSQQIMAKLTGRKALIMFSDGADYGSRTSLESSIEAAQRADTLIYSIYFAGDFGGGGGFGGGMPMGGRGGFGGGGFGGGLPGGGESMAANGRKALRQMSQETGGAYFEAGNAKTLDKVYAKIEEELRNQYNLGYTSDQHGTGFRKLKVTVKKKGLKVQARAGYFAR